MASFALLAALSGFRYSAVEKTLWFGPKLGLRPFKVFFSAASGFGTIQLTERQVEIRMIEGELQVDQIVLTHGPRTRALDWRVTARQNAPAVRSL
jgi:hypothetical protein